MKPVYIGTSGFSYKSWGNHFYPGKVAKNRQLEFYLTQFPTVEINATFYRLATLAMTRRWNDIAPEGFLYALKGSRFITHIKRLKNVEDALDTFFKRVAPLKEKTGPILWQLPPTFQKDCQRLGDFLGLLPKSYEHAIEFRHASWQEDEQVFKMLKKYHVAFVSVSSGKWPMNLAVTADFIYIRFHGLTGGAAHDYTRAELKPWADHICGHHDKKAFVYFNNDVNVRAPQNARELMGMIGERALGPFATELHAPTPKRGITPKGSRGVTAKGRKPRAMKEKRLHHEWAESG